jgi:hypothetical protein
VPGKTAIVSPGAAASIAAWIDSQGWTVTVMAPAGRAHDKRAIAKIDVEMRIPCG